MNPSPAEMLERRRLLTFFRVDTTADVVDANDGKLSLREAVAAANANAAVSDAPAGEATGDVLRVDQSIAGRNFALSSTLTITDDLSLLATGASFVGGAFAGPVLHVRPEGAEQVVFDAEIARDGDTPGDGGGILYEGLHSGAALGLRQGRVLGNHADGDGGGLFHTGPGRSTVRDTFFTQNSADGSGGAVALANGARMTVRDALFVTNTADTHGGAFRVGAGSHLTLEGTTVRNNRAGTGAFAGTGGGLSVVSGAAAAVTDAVFDHNRSTGDGGGIHTAGDLSLGASTVRLNTAGAGSNHPGSGGGIALGPGGTRTGTGNDVSGNTPDDVHDACGYSNPQAQGADYRTELIARGGTLSNVLLGSAGTASITYVVTRPPEHGTLESFDAATGAFTYRAPEFFPPGGRDSFEFRVTDGCDNGSPVAAVLLGINNGAPSEASPEYSTFNTATLEVSASDADGDGVYETGLLTDVTDPEGDGVEVVVPEADDEGAAEGGDGGVATDHGRVTLRADGSFKYTPDLDAAWSGEDTFSYEVVDEFDAATTGQATIKVGEAAIFTSAGPVGDEPAYGWVGKVELPVLGYTGEIDATFVEGSARWNVGGPALKNWDHKGDPAWVVDGEPRAKPIPAEDLQSPSLAFFWTKPSTAVGGGPYAVSVSAEYDLPEGVRQTVTATGEFIVGGPDFRGVRHEMGSATVVHFNEPGEATSDFARVSLLRPKPHPDNPAIYNDGIELGISEFGSPAGFPESATPDSYELFWVQLVTDERAEFAMFDGRQENYNLAQANNGRAALDGSYRYLHQEDGVMVDSPGIYVTRRSIVPAFHAAEVQNAAISQSFDSYLMYRPSFDGFSIEHEVPMMKTSWGWSGSMSRTSSTGFFSKGISNRRPPSNTLAWPSYPEWTGVGQTLSLTPANWVSSFPPGG